MMTTQSLVLTPAELAALPDATPIDVTWFMPNVQRNPDEEFLAKRIPRARRMNLDVVASKHPLNLPHMMPDTQTFANACEKIGVAPSTHVVFYDTHGVFSSPRALFMFKAFGHQNASILNGGLPRWQAEGRLIETGEPQAVEHATYPTPLLNKDLIRGYDQMVQNAKAFDAKSQVVLDARPHGRYTGKDPEPRPNLSSGHVPSSLSLPFSEVVQQKDGWTELRSQSELLQIVGNTLKQDADRVLSHERQVVNTCGSGMTAAVLWLTLQQLGVNSAIYDESWMGYAARPESVIEKGEGRNA